jgi:hypothetical protein
MYNLMVGISQELTLIKELMAQNGKTINTEAQSPITEFMAQNSEERVSQKLSLIT